MASAAGFEKAIVIEKANDLRRALKRFEEKGPIFMLVKIEKGNARVSPIPLSPVEIRSRFMEEVKRG
jgi:hypothetical protein